MNRVGLGLAVGAGYVLGRTKKMKLAFAVGTLVAGKRMNLSPRALADLVSGQLRNNPQFKELGDQLRQDLRGVGGAATGALLERQLDTLADRLHDRTAGVRERLNGVVPERRDLGYDDEEPEEEGYADEPDEEDRYADEPDGEDRYADEPDVGEPRAAARKNAVPKERPAKKAEAKKATAKKATAKTAAAKKVPAKKVPAKKAPAKKAPAKKVAKKAPARKAAPAKKAAAKRTAARKSASARMPKGGGE